jgi:hypothetical protein
VKIRDGANRRWATADLTAALAEWVDSLP